MRTGTNAPSALFTIFVCANKITRNMDFSTHYNPTRPVSRRQALHIIGTVDPLFIQD